MRFLIWLALSVLTAGVARADGGRIAVLDLRARLGAKPELAAALSDDLVTEVRRRSGQKVVGSDEIRSMLSFAKTKQQLGCDELACLTEIGGALGAERLVSGTLARFGETYLLTMRLIDVRRSQVIRDASERLIGDDEAALLDLVSRTTADLFPEAARPMALAAAPAAPAAPAAVPAAAISLPRYQPPPKSHVPSIVLWSIGGALLAGAVIGTAEVIQFDNLKGQSTANPIPVSQGYGAQANALWGLPTACVATPLALLLGTVGALAW